MQSPSSSATPLTPSNPDLEEFRKQWKQEVSNKKARSNLPPDSPFATPPDSPPLRPALGEDEQAQHARAYCIAKMASAAACQSGGGSAELSSALDVYLMAIEMERQGQLGQALTYYRRAFRLDPDVDTIYLRQCDGPSDTSTASAAVAAAAAASSPRQKKTHQDPLVAAALADSSDVAALLGISYHDNYLIAHQQPNPRFVDTLDALAYEIIQQDIDYKPAIDYKPVLIARLPDEILVEILSHMLLYSVSSVARFALVCRRFFLATRSPTLWRHACEHVFCTPGMTLEQSRRCQAEFAATLYDGHWLRMYIERPRLHFDGVYISVCQYIRPGESETSAWTRPVHLVTYYRYIRFFSDGTMIKYLSTDAPAQVVRLLNPEFSRRQVFHGRYRFIGPQTIDVEMRDRSRPREKFEMMLDLKSTRRGRHNKLVWQQYRSRKDDREEGTAYDLAMMRPFLFSVVRSFRK
ncbi:hypothetical protein BX666DRAFT_2031301 [Dichotomocladium elegans]|nr:hypothetical protein BX666DRAFT_2031301 [Dichotomocladium elegans]